MSVFSWSLCAFNVKSFCLCPVLEAQLAVFRGPPLAPSSVLLPAPVGKQITPPPNTGSGAALCCGRAGRCPSGCRSQMLQTGQVGGQVVPPPSTLDRGCVPARKARGRSPSTCAAGSSAALCGCALCPGRRSAGGLGEDRGTALSLLRAKTQLLVCLCGASSLRDQDGRILSAPGCRPVSVWPLRLLSPSVRMQVSPPPPPECSARRIWRLCLGPASLPPKTFRGFSEMGVCTLPPRAHQPCCFMEGPGCSALCTHSHGMQPLAFHWGCLRAATYVLRPACAAWPCPPLPARVSGLVSGGDTVPV